MNGKNLYKNMEANLGEVLSINAIQRHMQCLEGFKHRKIQLLSHFNITSKEKLVQLAETFWLFLKSAKAVAPLVEFFFYLMDK